MEKSYRAELVGLFGDPVDENPTGVMMEAGFKAQNLNYRYITLRVQKGNLKEAMEAVRLFGMKGVNLTIPHKVDVLPFLDELSPAAEITGAVNSVLNDEGRLIGENTDGKGFITSLMEEGVFVADKIVTVLGAGGAARAVAVECALSGAKQIHIINRNEEKGQKLAALIQEKTKAQSDYLAWKGTAILPGDTNILVNFTCVGLYPDTSKPDICYEDITGKMTVCDVVFNPPQTGFLKEAVQRGAKTVNGLGMLVNQGALNYSLWTEHMAPKQAMVQALQKEFDLSLDESDIVEIQQDSQSRERNLIGKMIDYYEGDPKRVQHFLKVYEFARLIGEAEELPKDTLTVLKTAAIVHDIGIKVSEQKYDSSAGKYQEQEGPAIAEPMLRACGYEEEMIDRVLFLIAHHHTYNQIDGIDYQILVEADFLVNLFEDNSNRQVAENVKENIFRTKTGLWYLEKMFLTLNK